MMGTRGATARSLTVGGCKMASEEKTSWRLMIVHKELRNFSGSKPPAIHIELEQL